VKCVRVLKDDVEVAASVEVADSFFRRFLGLMFRNRLADGCGLLLVPCSQIHTFSMKFAIDAVFLDENNVILIIEKEMKPWRAGKNVSKAAKVLELNAGTAEALGLMRGDRLDFLDKASSIGLESRNNEKEQR